MLLLGVFGLAAVLQVRMTGWFAIVWGVALAPHAADIVAACANDGPSPHPPRPTTDDEPTDDESSDVEHPALRFRFTLGCVGMIWIAFAFTTLSRPLIGGKPRSPAALYGEGTPLGVSAFLAKTPLAGQAFNPQYWGDWLGRTVPQLPLFATTNVHLLPRVVWNDYQRIARADNGWEGTLGRYAVRTVIVDRKNQPALARAMKASPDWTQVYEDEQALVYRLKATTGAAPGAAQPHPRRSTKHFRSHLVMHLRNDAEYSHARASGLAKFLVFQAAILVAGCGLDRDARVSAQQSPPTSRVAATPLEVRPIYDYPVVVSDEQLSRVLTKLRPKNGGPKMRLGHIDHALRFWTAGAKFKRAGLFLGRRDARHPHRSPQVRRVLRTEAAVAADRRARTAFGSACRTAPPRRATSITRPRCWSKSARRSTFRSSPRRGRRPSARSSSNCSATSA